MSEDTELLQTFSEEAADIIEELLEATENFFSAKNPKEILAKILRGLHTVKGGAGAVKLLSLRDAAHQLESGLLEYKDHPETIDSSFMNAFHSSIDGLTGLLAGESENGPTTESGLHFFDAELPTQKLEISRIEVKDKRTEGEGAILRIPLSKVEKTLDYVSELFLTRNQMSYYVSSLLTGEISLEDFSQQYESCDHILRQNIADLEREAMSMRMTPIKPLMKRMAKTIESYLSEASHKSIKLEIIGEDTEIDKKVYDTLGDPLIHLTRNAMDHGIEAKEDRLNIGKSEVATIKLQAQTVGGEVLISVSDDGKGIDPKDILASAKKKGFDVSSIKTDQEALQMIFIPGFSTKDALSSISGRGIGLDSVKTYVQNLHGEILIDTKKGEGTTFTMKLPLGLSVVPSVLVKVHNQTYALMSSDLSEAHHVDASKLQKNGDEHFYERQGKFIPAFQLGDFLTGDGDELPTNQLMIRKAKLPLCIAKSFDLYAAFCVDEILGHKDVVVKQMPYHGMHLPYAVGVSILATGEPIFILSCTRILDFIRRKEELPQLRMVA